MKSKILFILLCLSAYGFSQSVNDYKAVIIPLRYEFQKEDNQYRIQTKTKVNLQNSGFQAFYSNQDLPTEIGGKCACLHLDMQKISGFLITKLQIILRDCNNTIIYQSEIGKSREKDFELAYTEAMNDAFKSVAALKYKYNGTVKTNTSNIAQPVVAATALPAVLPSSTETTANLLYAQPTAYGYQLIDSEPKVIFKVFKTSNPNSFMAKKGEIQGTLFVKDNQWFFEYFKGETLMSEKVAVKF